MKEIIFKDFLGSKKEYIYHINRYGYYSLNNNETEYESYELLKSNENTKLQNICRKKDSFITNIFRNITRNQNIKLLKKSIPSYIFKDDLEICEIGIGRGKIIDSLLTINPKLKIIGFEPNEDKYVHAQRLLKEKAEIINDVFDLKYVGERKFDLIILFHVLEHIINVDELIINLKYVTKQNGMIFIAVPNVESLQYKLFKKLWFHSCAPLHIHQFGYNSLIRYLNSYNIYPISKGNIDILNSSIDWFQSSLNILPGSTNMLFRKFQKIGKDINNLETFLLIPFYLLILPFIFLICITGLTFELICRKYSTLNMTFYLNENNDHNF